MLQYAYPDLIYFPCQVLRVISIHTVPFGGSRFAASSSCPSHGFDFERMEPLRCRRQFRSFAHDQRGRCLFCFLLFRKCRQLVELKSFLPELLGRAFISCIRCILDIPGMHIGLSAHEMKPSAASQFRCGGGDYTHAHMRARGIVACIPTSPLASCRGKSCRAKITRCQSVNIRGIDRDTIAGSVPEVNAYLRVCVSHSLKGRLFAEHMDLPYRHGNNVTPRCTHHTTAYTTEDLTHALLCSCSPFCSTAFTGHTPAS